MPKSLVFKQLEEKQGLNTNDKNGSELNKSKYMMHTKINLETSNKLVAKQPSQKTLSPFSYRGT